MRKNKQKKKKGLGSVFKFFIIIIILVFTFFLLGAYVFKFETKTIVVHNNKFLSDEEIIIYGFENSKSSNFLLTNPSTIENKLIKNDLIKSVKVKKKLLLEIHIYVKENKPLFLREDVGKIVLEDGKEINLPDESSFAIPSLINYVPNDKYKKLIEKFTGIDYTIISKISDIKYDPNKYDEDRFLLYMNDSNRVYINLPKIKNLNKYNKMVEKFEGKKGTLYLDSGNYFKVDK